MNIKHFSITLCLLVTGALGYWLLPMQQVALEKDLKSQYLKGGDFQLQYDGLPFKLSSLKGQPVILYFGYTNCPDVCPVGLAVIRDLLNSDSSFNVVKTLFVTLDPERDSAQKMDEYAAFFHSNILALTGTEAEIKQVTDAYGTFFRRALSTSSETDNEYTVDHSSYYYLIDKQGTLVRVLNHDTKSAEMAKIVSQLL
mgnify:CR=1 FL=1